jgi:uncharacterized protein (DUF2141 family)
VFSLEGGRGLCRAFPFLIRIADRIVGYFYDVPFLRRCCSVFLLSVLASCASQIPPSGGAKDITPPVVTHESPANLSTGFRSEKIVISFDEYVQLNDPNNQVFFSPAISGKVTYRLKGKSLVIALEDSLKPNTTYTVNFGSAIKDNAEGNILLNYQYVFSTGSAIDSFRISGKVVNAFTGKSKSNYLVMLHRDLSDSAMLLHRPDYNARTDSSGYFVLDHLKRGTYTLSAVDDQNFNFMFDQTGELVAFTDTPLVIFDTLAFYKLLLFKPAPERQAVLGTFSRQPGRASFALALPSKSISIRPVLDTLIGFTEWNTGMDTVSVWVNDVVSDSIAFQLSDGDFADTVKVRMKGAEGRQKSPTVPKLSITSVSLGKAGAPLRKGDALMLYFDIPVMNMNESRKVFLRDDSVKKEYEVKPMLLVDSSSGKQRCRIDFKFLEARSYSLIIPDSVFTDLFGNQNDSSKIQFHVYAEEDLGNLNLKISFSDSSKAFPYFYEFRTKDGTLISKDKVKAGTKTLSFKLLPPGEYSFKIIEDSNGNRQWDTGDYWKRRQPERIFFYSGAITLRANWDVDAQMKIDNR